MDFNQLLSIFQPFILSLAMGMLIGIERERKMDKSSKAIGLRTFVLIALCGTIAAKLEIPNLTLALSCFVFATILVSYFRATEAQKMPGIIGITTEMAAGMVYVLGYMMYTQIILSSTLAILLFLLLYGRSSLHAFAKETITAKEIEASVTIMIITLAVISFLPNKTVDHWQLFNPKKAGIIVLLLASMEFGGYIAIRLFGKALGMKLFGFFSGLISSTTLFASIAAEEYRKKTISYANIIACIFASIASLIAFLIILAAVNIQLLLYISWPVLTAILMGFILSYFFNKKTRKTTIEIQEKNPLDILSIFKTALIILSILLLLTLSEKNLGTESLPIISLLTGLFSTHGMAYAIGILYSQTSMDIKEASQLLAITVFAGFISKFILVWLITRRKFASIISLVLGLMLASAMFVYYLTMP